MTTDQATTLDHPETRRADMIAVVERAQADAEVLEDAASGDDADTWAMRARILGRLALDLRPEDDGPTVLRHAPLWGWSQGGTRWLVTDATLEGYIGKVCADVHLGAYDLAEDCGESPSLIDGGVPEWATDQVLGGATVACGEARATWGPDAAEEVAEFFAPGEFEDEDERGPAVARALLAVERAEELVGRGHDDALRAAIQTALRELRGAL